MNQSVKLSGGLYEYKLPPVPRREQDILFYDLPKKEQYWRTPQIKDVNRMGMKERLAYIDMWRERWLNGVWMFQEGEPVYLTGIHVDHLVFMKFGDKNATYFDHQRNDFYFRDLTWNDDLCRGRIFMKPRRYGMTMQEITEATYRLNQGVDLHIGLQSDTPVKAKTTLMDPIIDAYPKRPIWMRSDYYKPNGKKLTSYLSLKSHKAEDDGNNLNGWIRLFATLPRAMDGNLMIYIVMDEIWKWQTSRSKEVLESNLLVTRGFDVSGKISALSTMGDSDDYINAVMDGIEIIARSNPEIRNENGQTLSGLYKYFVSAVYSFEIPPHIFEVDKLGRVNVDKHLSYINNELRTMDKSSKSYIFFKRRMPLNESDVILSSNMKSDFRRQVIANRLNEILAMTAEEKMSLYRKGNFITDSRGLIYFDEDPEGIVLLHKDAYVSMDQRVDTRNRLLRSYDNILFPPTNPEGAIGYDPVSFGKGQTSSDHLSRAAIFARKKFDYYRKPGDPEFCEEVPMALALWRPDDPHDANKVCMDMAKYFGYPVMHERSVNHVIEDFDKAGMGPFLLKDETGTPGISPSSTRTRKDGYALLLARYSAPKVDTVVDQLAMHPFEDCLRNFDNFDFDNTTPFDAAMAEIYCELGLKQLVRTNVTDGPGPSPDEVMDRILGVRLGLKHA